MDSPQQPILSYIDSTFYTTFVDALSTFISIPSLSPLYDPNWKENRNLFKQAQHLTDFANTLNIQGLTIQTLEAKGRSPFLIADIQPTSKSTNQVLFYGHLDKQPFGDGWLTDPSTPTLKDGKLYGRGSVDDGYAFFSAITAVKACQIACIPHPKVTIVIEGSEEGDIADLLYYMGEFSHLLGLPDIVVCLDTFAASKESLSITCSLRGSMTFDIEGACLQEVMGKVERLQDFKSQRVNKAFEVEIPEHRRIECKYVASKLPSLAESLPLIDGLQVLGDKEEIILNNYWRPTLSVIGIEELGKKIRLSMRLPPTLDSQKAKQIVLEILSDTKVTFLGNGTGFNSPALSDQVMKSLNEAHSQVFKGEKPLFIGCGASIPFMEVFKAKFPKAQYILTGCAFLDSNAHSANENIDLDYCKKLMKVIALFLSQL
ncbi:hypothetical protein FGO68_gene10208 [Halteria grandinella]|uniref:M20/M25/M40 family metallo-hydrolase n=1 Tax=Halteria grandinella TaxID=5974 RepID=A0A8J8NMC1_HALGN|nr:hypothetical protein FGO68_gene10208 [Halteria grandinella]